MKNYLTTTDRKGRQELTIMNTSVEDYDAQLEAASALPNIGDVDKYSRVNVLPIKRGEGEAGFDPNAAVADALASRSRWTLYDEQGKVIGSGNGTWAGWHVKSPMIDQVVVGVLALAKIESMRGLVWKEINTES